MKKEGSRSGMTYSYQLHRQSANSAAGPSTLRVAATAAGEFFVDQQPVPPSPPPAHGGGPHRADRPVLGRRGGGRRPGGRAARGLGRRPVGAARRRRLVAGLPAAPAARSGARLRERGGPV